MVNIDSRLLPYVDCNEMWFLLQLAKRINSNRMCWPSNKTLCEDTGWHIEKIQRVKKRLIDKRLIKVEVRNDNSNIYRIGTRYISFFINSENVEFEEITPTGKSDIDGKSITLPTGKSDNKVLATEVLTNTAESINPASQKALFDSSPEKKPLPQKKKKETAPADEFYPLFVKAWCDRYPELGFNAISGVKIKSIVNHTKTYLKNGDKPQTPEQGLAMFEYVLEYVKRVNHFCHGKPITTFDSQYLSIIFELKNGKSTGAPKKQSAREWANSL